MRKSIHRVHVVLSFAALVAGCGGGNETGTTTGTTGTNNPDVIAGTNALVAIVNPVVNDPNTTPVPAAIGAKRDGISIVAKPGGTAVTADEGLAVVDIDVGPMDLRVGDAHLSHTVLADGDVYDAPIAYDGSAAAFFQGTPVRYAVGKASGAIFFDPEDKIVDINGRLAQDDVVVVLGPGLYKGDLVITGSRVILFGEGFEKRSVRVAGSITVNGGGVRIRGVTIDGDVTSKGNNFGISFSVVKGAMTITGNAGAFVRNVFCGNAVVPSSNATLLDNYGIAPITSLPKGVCD